MSTCFLVIIAILHLSSCQTLECRDAFECANQTTAVSVNYTIISSKGYKSHYGPSSSIILYGSLKCTGAFACAEASFLSGSGLICDGDSSCSKIHNIKMIYVHSSTSKIISVSGANGLIYSTVSDAAHLNILCRGEQSCAHSSLSGFSAIEGAGAYSLLNATIDSINGTSNISIDLCGYYAGLGTTITCRTGQSCAIHCYSTGCSNVHLNCDDNCIIYGILNHVSSIQNLLFYDSFVISQANDAACSAQIDAMNFDDYGERFGFSEVLDNSYGGPICCRGHQSCYTSDLQYTSFVNESIICSADQSCSRANLYHNGPLFCGGDYACAHSHIITTGIVYCNGASSCFRSFIIGSSHIYCTGYGACGHTLIRSNGANLNLYLLGYRAGQWANITCSASDECYILCGGSEACSGVALVCDGTCNVFCDQDSMCPNGWNATSTATTIDPTQSSLTIATTFDSSNLNSLQRTTESSRTGAPITSTKTIINRSHSAPTKERNATETYQSSISPTNANANAGHSTPDSVLLIVLTLAAVIAIVVVSCLRYWKRKMIKTMQINDANINVDDREDSIKIEGHQNVGITKDNTQMEESEIRYTNEGSLNQNVNDVIVSMTNSLNRVPLTSLVTTRGNDQVLDEIEGDGEGANAVDMRGNKVEMGDTHDGTRGTGNDDIETKPTIALNVYTANPTAKGDAIEDV